MMVDASTPRSELSIQTRVMAGRAETVISINGVDLLDLSRSTRGVDGSEDSSESRSFLPTNPVELLPPDSAALLATTAPRHAMVGVCTCGEPGCSSLWVQVRREGGEVVWEPDPDAPTFGRTVDTSWRFGLRQYLDALDDAQRSVGRWETRLIRIARALRRQRDELDGFPMVNSVTGAPMRLLDAVAWPGQDYVLVSIASDTGPRQLHVAVDDARTDREIIWQLHSVDPEQHQAARAGEVEPASEAAAAGASASRQGLPEIVVGTKNFPEQYLLGELYAQALRARGFQIMLKHNLGSTPVLNKALDRGHISMYPEYTGVIYTQLAQLGSRPPSARAAYEAAKQWEASHGNAMLEPSAFHTIGCVVARKPFAHERGLNTIDDLSRLGHLTFGGPPELLTDTEEIFGYDQAAPVLKISLLATLPPVFAATLNQVSSLLSTDVMISLNKAVQLDKQDPSAVAATFLNSNGLLR